MSDHEAEARKVAEETAKECAYMGPYVMTPILQTAFLAFAKRVREPLEIVIRTWAKNYHEDINSLRAQLAEAERTRDDAHIRNFKEQDEHSHQRAQLVRELAEAVERAEAAEAELGEVRRLWSQTNGALDRKLLAAEAKVEELEKALRDFVEATPTHVDGGCHKGICSMEECGRCSRTLRGLAALARPEARTPEPKDPLSISYVAVTRGREWPRPEHKREWNQEQDDSWCSYCHVQWPCDEAKP